MTSTAAQAPVVHVTGTVTLGTGLGSSPQSQTYGSLFVGGAAPSTLYLDYDSLDVLGNVTVAGNSNSIGLRSGAVLQAASLTLAPVSTLGLFSGPDLFIDQSSAIEVGHAGGAKAGFLTVDAGATLSGNGRIDAPVIDNGTVDVAGDLTITGAVTGTGVLRIESHSGLQLFASAAGSVVSSGVTIDFAGPEAQLEILPFTPQTPTPIAPGTVIQGLASGDTLSLGFAAASATFTPGASGGTLTLSDSTGHVLQSLALQDVQSGLSFLLLNGGAEVVVADAATGAASSGTATNDRYEWTGAVSSDWTAAGNWLDLTRGGTASIAPGNQDEVTVDGDPFPQVVTGVGRAKSLTIGGNVTLAGRAVVTYLEFLAGSSDFNTGGTLTVAGRDGLLIVQTANFAVQPLSISETLYGKVIVDGGVFRAVEATGGNLTALDGGFAQIGQFVQNLTAEVDPTSRIEIGSATQVVAGGLTVGPNAYVTGTISVAGTGNFAARGLILQGATVYGSFSADTMIVDGTLICAQGTSGGYSISGAYSISGTGSIDIMPGATLDAEALDTVNVSFAGPGAALDLGVGLLPPDAVYGATLTGFGPGDSLYLALENPLEDQATYVPGAGGQGTLTISDHRYDGTVHPLRIRLEGNYANDRFVILPTNTLPNAVVVVLPPVNYSVQPSAGTAAPDTYTWAGSPLGGDAGTPANWKEAANGAAVSVAPGLQDTIEIAGPNPIFPALPVAPLVLTGTARVAALSASGDVVLDGRFDAQNVTLGGTVTVAGLGAFVNAVTLNVTDTFDVDAAAVHVSGTADISGLCVLHHSAGATVGDLILGGGVGSQTTVQIDGNSYVNVGGTGASAAGAVTVQAGATLSGSGTISASVVDDGTIAANGLEVTGNADGTGSITATGAGLTIEGNVGAGISIALVGADVPLFLGTQNQSGAAPSAVDGVISGFAAGDSISLTGVTTATQAAFHPGTGGLGTLSLADAAGHVLDTLTLAGNYAGAQFLLQQQPGFGVEITLAGGAHTVG